MKDYSTHFINHKKLYKYYLNDLVDPLNKKLPSPKEQCVFLNPNTFIKCLHLNLLNNSKERLNFFFNKGIIVFNMKTFINSLYKSHGNILMNTILMDNETETEDKLEIFKDLYKPNFNLKYIKERENQLISNNNEICVAYFKVCNCFQCCDDGGWETNNIIKSHIRYKLEKHIAKKYNIKNTWLCDFKG